MPVSHIGIGRVLCLENFLAKTLDCVLELCGGELCGGSCVEGAAWGVVLGDCVGELGGAVWGHAHQSPDGPDIHTPLPPGLPAPGD